MQFHCVHCNKDVQVGRPKKMTLHSGSQVIVGSCPKCGKLVQKHL